VGVVAESHPTVLEHTDPATVRARTPRWHGAQRPEPQARVRAALRVPIRGDLHRVREGVRRVKLILERDPQQEGEQDLRPGLSEPQLLQQLVPVPIEALTGTLVVPHVRHEPAGTH